ncbi:uncharacterized protein LOC127707519 isoform X2 [Mytilus californianus]|uniref:uncharacterized protein LOC127707519 isoform X2 n=1 Tax=Mytilus californianus TaxID=6549 RepID=UPI002247910D|nr:uncharacterized protein LOC127707519 isoform X2 [Mytilus californianus]
MDDKREGLDYTYAGCYDRFFKYISNVFNIPRLNMSPFVCMRHCQTRSPSKYFGITGGDVCSCLDEDYENRYRYIFDANGPFKVNDTECGIYCFRDTVNKCGGNSTISIYNIVANVIAGVAVGLTLLLIMAVLVALIRKRSRSNAKRSLQSCSNTNESVRYDNIPQSTQGVNGPYATLTVANDCQTYDDLMPTEGTYENTSTMATHYEESTQDIKKQRRKKRTKR